MNRIKKTIIAFAASMLVAGSAQALSINVGDEVGIKFVDILGPKAVDTDGDGDKDQTAGLLKFQVCRTGETFLAYCTELSQKVIKECRTYTGVEVENAPNVPGAMGADAALLISKLFDLYWFAGLNDSNVAAGLQVAIWEVALGLDWVSPSKPVVDAAAMIAAAQQHTGTAKIIALSNPNHQDIIIRTPDSAATVALLGLGLLGLAAVRRRLA